MPRPSADDHIGYEPALDGLRGIAVLAVLLFHGEVSWAEGGYLGVSTFFTLSGFLITTLILREERRRGGLDLTRFWSRRFRRLMPASLLCLGGVVVFGATVATAAQLVDLRGDVLAALAYVANWRLIAVDQSYAELFVAPSPVQHFWSLAIEEQFYLVFPLLLAGLVAVGRGSRRVLLVALGGLAVGSVVLTAVLTAAGASADRVYYGTDTRAAELLVGAVLAVLVDRAGTAVVAGPRARWVRGAGLAALALTVVLWATQPVTSGWLYRGGLGAYALVSAAIVLAAVQPAGPVRAALSWRPLVVVGLVSYGVYLYHWPIFLWLDAERTGLDGPALLALRFAVTGVAAAASYLLVERPVRARRALTGLQPWVAAPAAAMAVAVGVIAVTADPPTDQVVDFAEAQELVGGEDGTTFPSDEELGPDENVDGAPTVSFYGDSVALTLAAGAAPWLTESPQAARGGGSTLLGCGIGRGGERIYEEGPASVEDDCWTERWGTHVTFTQPDLAVLLSGPWDITDRMIPGEDVWRAPGDPVYDDYLRGEMEAAVDLLSSQGALVVWLTTPRMVIGQEDGEPPAEQHPASEAGRVERFNELVYEVAASRPDDVVVLDLRSYLQSLPGGEVGAEVRPDGVHFTTASSRQVVADWLGPQLLSVWERHQAATTTTTTAAPVPAPLPAPAG